MDAISEPMRPRKGRRRHKAESPQNHARRKAKRAARRQSKALRTVTRRP